MLPANYKTDFNAETMTLYRMAGVAGLLLQKGENVIANHMPFSDRRTRELSDHIRAMCAGYAAVGRSLRQVLFVFDGGALIVVNHQEVQLALMLSMDAHVDVAANAMALFMSEHAPVLATVSAARVSNKLKDPLALAEREATKTPVATAAPAESWWPEVRKRLEAVLGKTMGRAQMGNFIERVLKATGVADTSDLSLSEAKSVALTVLAEIPNRSKRQSLVSELDSVLAELKPNSKK